MVWKDTGITGGIRQERATFAPDCAVFGRDFLRALLSAVLFGAIRLVGVLRRVTRFLARCLSGMVNEHIQVRVYKRMGSEAASRDVRGRKQARVFLVENHLFPFKGAKGGLGRPAAAGWWWVQPRCLSEKFQEADCGPAPGNSFARGSGRRPPRLLSGAARHLSC